MMTLEGCPLQLGKCSCQHRVNSRIEMYFFSDTGDGCAGNVHESANVVKRKDAGVDIGFNLNHQFAEKTGVQVNVHVGEHAHGDTGFVNDRVSEDFSTKNRHGTQLLVALGGLESHQCVGGLEGLTSFRCRG